MIGSCWKSAMAHQKPHALGSEVPAREVEERLSLRDDVRPRVGVRVEPVGLTLGEEEAPLLVAHARRERVPRAGQRSHHDTRRRTVSLVTRVSRISSKVTEAA